MKAKIIIFLLLLTISIETALLSCQRYPQYTDVVIDRDTFNISHYFNGDRWISPIEYKLDDSCNFIYIFGFRRLDSSNTYIFSPVPIRIKVLDN